MARLTCSACGTWLVDVSDDGWRITARSRDVAVLDACVDPEAVPSAELWADLELVNARTDEWRDRGVYDPLPPPPDPPNPSLVLRCACGREATFARPG